MSSATTVCRKCGAENFVDAPEGLCTACLFETGLGLLSAADEFGPIENAETNDAHTAARSGTTPRLEKTLADFGDYELLKEIGRGGQGVVFRARQRSLNRTVALKVIGLGHWATEAHLKRFRREAEAAASLDHPGIVPIYEVGERDGSCYFSMKFVEGGQLDEVVRCKPLSIRETVELIAKVARTVHYAHEHGILHRDIKPGNILLDGKGEPHLTDFGLARLVEVESTVTRTLEVLGTPSYMAPEQATGSSTQVTRPTDVYGLGAVLYQLLTGHPPFAGGTTYETVRLLLETEPRSPRLWNSKIDRDVSTICLKCLEKDPSRRYSFALALAEDLERWLKHEPIRARRTGLFVRGAKCIRRNPTTTGLLAALVTLATTVAVLFFNREPARPPAGIAVLPFENLDGNKADATFADGIQDDILTKLAKVADLKVISRTSVMQYRGAQNTRQIGEALHVSHVLEGTVRRDGNRIRLNTQLIDTRTDAHLWADTYDRDVADVFAMQSELAQRIADQLQAKISPREKAAIEQQPTKDFVAYNLYVEAKSLLDQAVYDADQAKSYAHVVELLSQAIARDPAFLLAYCRLAEAHDTIYFESVDRTPARLALAKAAIDSAFKLQPNSGDAHLALAVHLYLCYFDYDRARDELEIARRSLPNEARIFAWSGFIDRRQNRWHESVRNLSRAVELDPRNSRILASAAATDELMRNYEQEEQTLDRLIAIEPNKIDHQLRRAEMVELARADMGPMRALLEKMMSTDDPSLSWNKGGVGLDIAFGERDSVAANRALAALSALGEVAFPARNVGETTFSRSYLDGLVARMKGDAAAAHAAFSAARLQQEEAIRARPDYGPTLCVLGLIDAYLGRKDEALREGRRALELAPIAKDSLDGADVLYYYAVICAWVGERDVAIEQLETLARIPGGVTYGELRLALEWDPLHGDPRFETIAASLAPK